MYCVPVPSARPVCRGGAYSRCARPRPGGGPRDRARRPAHGRPQGRARRHEQPEGKESGRGRPARPACPVGQACTGCRRNGPAAGDSADAARPRGRRFDAGVLPRLSCAAAGGTVAASTGGKRARCEGISAGTGRRAPATPALRLPQAAATRAHRRTLASAGFRGLCRGCGRCRRVPHI